MFPGLMLDAIYEINHYTLEKTVNAFLEHIFFSFTWSHYLKKMCWDKWDDVEFVHNIISQST